MKNERFFELLCNIDDDMLIASEDNAGTSSKLNWIKWGMVAACFCLIFTLTICYILRDKWDGSSLNDPPRPASMWNGPDIIGKHRLDFGDFEAVTSNSSADIVGPCFIFGMVIEAEVIEVLPDVYIFPSGYGSQQIYHVAKLRVISEVRANGMPDEIFLRYPYYDTKIFDGYERFIMSIRQIGFEGYMLINGDKGRVEYFSDMFEVVFSDLGYGSVIAFNNGRVDAEFWDNTDYLRSLYNISRDLEEWHSISSSYPATKYTSIEKVKSNIIKAAYKDKNNLSIKYVTEAMVFRENEEMRAYVEPNELNVFSQKLESENDKISVEYTRIINGFPTDEKFTVSKEVQLPKIIYTKEEILNIFNLGNELEKLDLSQLSPPHISVNDGMELRKCEARGYYRKVDGEVYGIIRVYWVYGIKEIKNGYREDDLYYLYDSDGNGCIVERDELKSVIDDSSIIMNFSYNHIVQVNY